MTDSRRRSRRAPAANDNQRPQIKPALQLWMEAQVDLSIGAKFLLYLMVNHADENGECYVRSAHFQRITNGKERTITAWLKEFRLARLIVKTTDFVIYFRGKYPIYRLAPDEPHIQELAVRREYTPADDWQEFAGTPRNFLHSTNDNYIYPPKFPPNPPSLTRITASETHSGRPGKDKLEDLLASMPLDTAAALKSAFTRSELVIFLADCHWDDGAHSFVAQKPHAAEWLGENADRIDAMINSAREARLG